MKDLLNFLRVSIVGHFRSYAILLKQESEPVSGVAAPTGGSEEIKANRSSTSNPAGGVEATNQSGSPSFPSDLESMTADRNFYKFHSEDLLAQVDKYKKVATEALDNSIAATKLAQGLEGELAALKALLGEVAEIYRAHLPSGLDVEDTDLFKRVNAALGEKTATKD